MSRSPSPSRSPSATLPKKLLGGAGRCVAVASRKVPAPSLSNTVSVDADAFTTTTSRFGPLSPCRMLRVMRAFSAASPPARASLSAARPMSCSGVTS